MLCPRCETPTMDERDRDGITVDVCKTCRGIWLDRGELERLLAKADREWDQRDEREGGGRQEHDHEYDDRHDRGAQGKGHGRKRRWGSLFEMFD